MVDVSEVTNEVTVDEITYVVTLNTSAIIGGIEDLSDVIITSPVNGEGLTYSNGIWSNSAAGLGDMAKVVYDTDNDGVVDAAEVASSLTGVQADAIVANTSKISFDWDYDYVDLINKPSIPVNNNELINGAGFITSFTESDPIFVASQAFNIDASDITNLNNLSGTNSGDNAVNSLYSGLEASKEDTIVYPTESADTKYYRGDKTFHEIVIGSGGYASNAYLSNTVSTDITSYKQITYGIDSSETEETITVDNTGTTDISYLFELGVGVTTIPSGVWRAVFYGKIDSNVGDTRGVFTVFKRTIAGLEDDLFSITSEEMVRDDDYIRFVVESTQDVFTVNSTDRIGVRASATSTSLSDRTINYIIGDGRGAYFNTPLATRHDQLRNKDGEDAFQHLTLVNKTDLTDGGDTLLHYHSTDRNRGTHTGTQTASTISDFDIEVSNNVSVTANTAKISFTWDYDYSDLINTPTTITTVQASDITSNNAKVSYTDATKVGYLTVTQAVNLDTIESNVATNNAKNTNVSTSLSQGTRTSTTYGITSDGSANDIILPEATTTLSGVMSAAKFNNIVTNNAKVGITTTQAANIVTNNSKVSFDWDYDYTDLINKPSIPVTAVDFDPVGTDNSDNNAVNTLYSSLISYPGSADATELNILEGATLSTIELNYVKGVTSAIQTQLNAKGTLDNIKEDTTPELGGELDAGAHSIGFTAQTATGDGTTTIDWGNGNKFNFTFGAFNETFTFTAPNKPGNFLIKMVQDSVGSRTATWPATVKWPGGTKPTLSTAASSVDIVSFYFDGTNYYGVGSLKFS